MKLMKTTQSVDPKLNMVINQVVKETQVPKNKLIAVVDSLMRNLGDRYSMSQIRGLIENSAQAEQQPQQPQQPQQVQQPQQTQGV